MVQDRTVSKKLHLYTCTGNNQVWFSEVQRLSKNFKESKFLPTASRAKAFVSEVKALW